MNEQHEFYSKFFFHRNWGNIVVFVSWHDTWSRREAWSTTVLPSPIKTLHLATLMSKLNWLSCAVWGKSNLQMCLMPIALSRWVPPQKRDFSKQRDYSPMKIKSVVRESLCWWALHSPRRSLTHRALGLSRSPPLPHWNHSYMASLLSLYFVLPSYLPVLTQGAGCCWARASCEHQHTHTHTDPHTCFHPLCFCLNIMYVISKIHCLLLTLCLVFALFMGSLW